MHSARLLFCLLVLGSCCAQDVLSPIGVITVTDSKGKEISSLSVQQHSEVQILQCRLGNAMVDWDILPHNPQIIMRYGGSLSVLSDVLMPKTTFTIVASNMEGNATLAFDIAVTPCEYGSFTLLEMKGLGKWLFQLYHDSEVIYNNTLTSAYLCLPRSTYTYTYLTDTDTYFAVSDNGGARFHTAFIAGKISYKGSFTNDEVASPSISFPSVVSVLKDMPKTMILKTVGAISNVTVSPELPVDPQTLALTVKAQEEGTTAYTITAFQGTQPVTTTFTVYCGVCPEGSTLFLTKLSYDKHAYALPDIDTPVTYSTDQSFCIPEGSHALQYFGGYVPSGVFLRFSEAGHTFYEFAPTSKTIDVYETFFSFKRPTAFSSTLSFTTATPDKRWKETRFKERGWSQATEGKWGSFGSASVAYFRSSFSVENTAAYTHMVVLARGEGVGEVFVNGHSQGTITLAGSDVSARIVVIASYLTAGTNVVAVALSKGVSSTIQFALSIEVNNAPQLQLEEGEASAIQESPEPSHPPQDAFDGYVYSYWSTSTFPSTLIYTFNSSQVVNMLHMIRPDTTLPYSLQLFGVEGTGRTLLASFNKDFFAAYDSYEIVVVPFANLQPFHSYHFVFDASNTTDTLHVSDVRLFNLPLYTCPKRWGYKETLEDHVLYSRCPLGSTGRRAMACMHDESGVHWSESREQCYASNPEKGLEFVDWTFTIVGMSKEAWETKQNDLTTVLIENTYLRVADVQYLYADFSYEKERTKMTVFSRCTIDTLLGELIKRNFERLVPRFNAIVARKMGSQYESSIDSVVLHRYVNWTLVITISCAVVVILVVLVVYFVLRVKNSRVRRLKKSGAIEQQSLLVSSVCPTNTPDEHLDILSAVGVHAVVLQTRIRHRQRVRSVNVQVVVDLPVHLAHASRGVEQALQHVHQHHRRTQRQTAALDRRQHRLVQVRRHLEDVGEHVVQQVLDAVLAALAVHAHGEVADGGTCLLAMDEVAVHQRVLQHGDARVDVVGGRLADVLEHERHRLQYAVLHVHLGQTVLVHQRRQHGERRARLRHDGDGDGRAQTVLALLHLQVVQQRVHHVLRTQRLRDVPEGIHGRATNRLLLRVQHVQQVEADATPLLRRHELGTAVGDAPHQVDAVFLHLLVAVA